MGLYNYFGWGFIAGLMDHFIRAQFSTTTTTDTMSTDTSSSDAVKTALESTQSGIEGADDETKGAVVETVKKVRNKNKQKKNKKNKGKHGMKKKDSQKNMETEHENEEAVVNV